MSFRLLRNTVLFGLLFILAALAFAGTIFGVAWLAVQWPTTLGIILLLVIGLIAGYALAKDLEEKRDGA